MLYPHTFSRVSAWPPVQLPLEYGATIQFDPVAASKSFLDIVMPPYQDRNDRNKRNKNIKKVAKRDPLYIDGQAPRPMYVDYKDLDLLTKLTNRHGRIVSRRKTGCHAASQHAVARAIKRARFMALLPYVGDWKWLKFHSRSRNATGLLTLNPQSSTLPCPSTPSGSSNSATPT